MFGRFRRRRAGTPQSADGSAAAGHGTLRRIELNPADPEYAALCLTPAFPEEPEPRTIEDGYALNRIVEIAGTSGTESPAMARLVEELLADPRYVDLDVLYAWLAGAYPGTDRELEVIEDGLRRCSRKHSLLDLAGAAMLERGHGADALYYWSQSVMNAESVGEGPGASAYDYLVVVAEVIGQHTAARAFRARADQDGPLQTVLDDVHTMLVEATFDKFTAPMTTVVQTLADQIRA
ncbi:hypothetical protein [Kribbella sp. CA-294648]|uniref:hypothetical protein n=1 Tax=Kribbella sp. CA-294648 TaxID=3239948 RepID=UPI003D8AFD07